VKPHTFEVKIFIAMAEDEGHDKIAHEAKDSNPQHEGDVDPRGRHKPFVGFIEDEKGNDKKA
jgi:hypothetical protein